MLTPSSAPHWAFEDGGPTRSQRCDGTLQFHEGQPVVTSRLALASTMVVWAGQRLFLLCHSAGDDAVSWVEELHPVTLETLARSDDLPAGPTWPGGLGAHDNGSLYLVFGNHAHRLSLSLERLASVTLPRVRPYNSFVVTSQGFLVTKDFGGARPGEDFAFESESCELVLLDPVTLEVRDRCVLPEGSIARLSADGDDVYVVGVSRLWRVRVDGEGFVRDDDFVAPYRVEGGGYGWDSVLVDGAAWFLDNGAGSAAFDGSLRGKGLATAPQRLVSVDLVSGAVGSGVVNDQPGGLVANPPAVDATRGIAVGYDSGNGVVTAFSYRETPWRVAWRRELNHGCHPLLDAESGVVMLNDFADGHDAVVLVDVTSGEVLSRVALESPLQSVLFPAPGEGASVYLCSFTHVERVAWT